MRAMLNRPSNHQHAYTDLYDEGRRAFLVQYPVGLIIGLGLAGVAVFMLTGFLGFRDPLEPDFTAVVFKEPWALYLWFCALIIALQCSILRHPSLRPQLVATLAVTITCIILVGVIYYYNRDLTRFLQDFLQNLGLRIPQIGQSALTYTVLNFGIIAIFWLSTIRRWTRRAMNKPLRVSANIGLDETVDLAATEPELPQLVAGDLIAGTIIVLVLGLLFQASVINALSNLLQTGVTIDTCAVTLPGTGCVSPGDLAAHSTLNFLDIIQALVYLPLGLLTLALSAVIKGLGQQVDADDTSSIYERVVRELINTVRAALNRRVGIAFNLALGLRTVAWPALILLGTIAVAAASRGIQGYLHLLSDQRTCAGAGYTVAACGSEQVADFVRTNLANFAQYQNVGLALLWGVIAVLSIVFSAALLLFRWRVAENSLRFLGLVGFTVLLTFWIFSLALSGFNGLFSLTHLSDRVPFPQPGTATIASFAALLLFGGYYLLQRLRRPRAGTPEPAPVASRRSPQ